MFRKLFLGASRFAAEAKKQAYVKATSVAAEAAGAHIEHTLREFVKEKVAAPDGSINVTVNIDVHFN